MAEYLKMESCWDNLETVVNKLLDYKKQRNISLYRF